MKMFSHGHHTIDHFLCMQIVYWKILLLFLIGLIAVMIATSVAMFNWVEQGEDDLEWSGSLFLVN
jgi:hypothetical protein